MLSCVIYLFIFVFLSSLQCGYANGSFPSYTISLLCHVFCWSLPPPILLPPCQLCLTFCRHLCLYLAFSLGKCLPQILMCSQNSYVDSLISSVIIFGDMALMRLSPQDVICALKRKNIKSPSFSFCLLPVNFVGKK